MAVYTLSLICACIIFCNSLLHLSLIFGAPLGEFILGGKNKVFPPKMRIMSVVFFCIFVFFGLVYLQYGNIINIGLNSIFTKIIVIINTAFFGYAIIGNGFLTKSKKERYLMTPVAIVTFALSLIIIIIG